MAAAGSSGYAITISAVDAATAVIDKINKRVDALNKRVEAAELPFKHLGESFETFAKVTGLEKIAHGFGEIAHAGGEALKKIMEIVEPLAAITGIVSLAGMYKLVSAWGEFGHVLSISANRAGMSADQLYLLQRATVMAGGTTDSLTDSMTTLNDNMRNVQFGGGANFLTVLRNLGISYEALAKESPVERLKTLATALTKVSNVADKALYIKELFGGEGLFSFLSEGGEGIEHKIEEVKELVGAYDVKKAMAFRDAEFLLGESVTGLGNAIANVLAPVLTPMLGDMKEAVKWMRDWVVENELWLRGEISEKIKEFGDYLKEIDWKQVGQDFKDFGHSVQDVATALGGWIPAGQKVLTFFAVTWLAGMLAPIVQISTALLGLPMRASVAAAGATTALGPLGVLLGRLGLLLATYEAMNQVGKLTDKNADGTPLSPTANFLHHFLFDNPLDWLGFNKPAGAPIAPSPGAVTDNARVMDNIFQTEGHYTAEGSAAMIGSGIQESTLGLDPKAREGGLYQWDKPRQDRIEAHFHKRPSAMTLEEQTRAAIWEIQTQPEFAAVNARLHTQHSVEGANTSVVKTYLAPADKDGNEVPHRLQLSQGVLDTLHKPTVAEQPLPIPPLPPPPPSHSEQAERRPHGDPVALPPGAAGAPGATGKVEMNVRVTGAPATVSAQATGGVGLNILNPGLVTP